MGNKRRRLALSCVDCRRRKVKCDRNYPVCDRCEKGGIGDKCKYVTYSSEAAEVSIPTPSDESPENRYRRAGSWVSDAEQWETTSRKTTSAQQQQHQREQQQPLQSQHQRQQPQPPSVSPPTILPPSSSSAQGTTARQSGSNVKDRRIAELSGRLMELETYVHAAGARPISAESNYGIGNPGGPGYGYARNPMSDRHIPSDHEKVLIRGSAFKTQYFGPSHDMSILLQFEELSTFVKEILLSIPAISCVKQSMTKIRDQAKKKDKTPPKTDLESLVDLVPKRDFADKLVNQYLDTVETTYRIVHIPTFMKHYEDFWTSPKEAKAEFVVQLLLTMASVYCVVRGGPAGFIGRSSARRETAATWISTCQVWLDEQSQKHVTLAYYQIHILIHLARTMNCIKIKREWTSIGHLVRLAMAAGLHREPSLLCRKITVFDSEMRRRIWFTILEMDLQSTIDRGMTPTIGSLDWDVHVPRNIDDESFSQETEVLPESKPKTEFTRTSFLHTINDHLALRVETLYRINSIRTSLEIDTVMLYDNKLRDHLDNLPVSQWKDTAATVPSPQPSSAAKDSSTNTNAVDTATTTAAATAAARPTSVPSPPMPLTPETPLTSAYTAHASPIMAAFVAPKILHEFILILHQPFATHSVHKSRHFFSRAARREACTAALTLTSQLDETRRRLMASLREDDVRSALSLAHDLAINNPPPSHIPGSAFGSGNGTGTGTGVGVDSGSSLGDNRRALDLLNMEVSILEDRVRHLGQGFHCYWITSSALSFVHSKQSPKVHMATFAQAAADRVVKLHGSVLRGQIPSGRGEEDDDDAGLENNAELADGGAAGGNGSASAQMSLRSYKESRDAGGGACVGGMLNPSSLADQRDGFVGQGGLGLMQPPDMSSDGRLPGAGADELMATGFDTAIDPFAADGTGIFNSMDFDWTTLWNSAENLGFDF